MRLLTLALLSVFTLVGCNDARSAWTGLRGTVSALLTRPAANWAEPDNYDAVFNKTERDVDVGGHPTYQGPIAYVDNDVRGHTYFMRATLPQDWPVDPEAEPVVLQIYVIANLASRTGLATASARPLDARSSSGNPVALDVTPLYQADVPCDRGLCPVREDVGVNMTLDIIDRFAAGGIDLTLQGEQGFIDLEIPGAYFAAFRDRIVEHRAE